MADPLIVKICGIRTHDMLEAAIDAGADMVGFMHFARSPRHRAVNEDIGRRISHRAALFNPPRYLRVCQVKPLRARLPLAQQAQLHAVGLAHHPLGSVR